MNDRPRQVTSSVHERPYRYDDDKYFAHLLDQYALYVEMVDRLSARRVLVNNTFITLMGAGAIAYAAAPNNFPGGFGVFFQLGVTFACILIAVLWRETIVHYKQLSIAKFKVIHEMEELLPAQLYKTEMKYFDEELSKRRLRIGRKFAQSLSQIEMSIPLLAVFVSAVGFIYTAVFRAIPLLPGVFG
jgi:hypothetical protein